MEESFLKENLFRYICLVVFCFATIFLFSYFNVAKTSLKGSKNANLVIYGDNISTAYTPFIQDDGIYISVDTISKVIDSHIYYDKQATKVIITTEDTVLKFKIDENKAHRNFVEESISTPARFINDSLSCGRYVAILTSAFLVTITGMRSRYRKLLRCLSNFKYVAIAPSSLQIAS